MAGKIEKAYPALPDFFAELADRRTHLAAICVFPVNNFKTATAQGRGYILGVVVGVF